MIDNDNYSEKQKYGWNDYLRNNGYFVCKSYSETTGN